MNVRMAQVLERRLEEAWIKEGVRLDLQGEDGYAFGRHSVRFVCMHLCTYVHPYFVCMHLCTYVHPCFVCMHLCKYVHPCIHTCVSE